MKIFCIKLQKEGDSLTRIPFPGDLGEKIYQNVSKEAWQMWLQHQTRLINEKQLSLLNDEDKDYLKQQVEKYFFSGDVDMPEGFQPLDDSPKDV